MPGVEINLEANPTYFRRYIWPDVCTPPPATPGVLDGIVGIDDIMRVGMPANIFKSENPDGTWPDPPGAWGEPCDVNKDGVIGVADIVEVGAHMGEPWPPPWYVDR